MHLGKIPRRAVFQKHELRPEDIEQADRVLTRTLPLDLAGKTGLVSCPCLGYEATTTKQCGECPFWAGFGPADMDRPIARGNIRSVCAYPISRDIPIWI